MSPQPPYLIRIADGAIGKYRRAYTYEHIAVAARIAEELGLIGRRPESWASSEFPRRVQQEWARLRATAS